MSITLFLCQLKKTYNERAIYKQTLILSANLWLHFYQSDRCRNLHVVSQPYHNLDKQRLKKFSVFKCIAGVIKNGQVLLTDHSNSTNSDVIRPFLIPTFNAYYVGAQFLIFARSGLKAKSGPEGGKHSHLLAMFVTEFSSKPNLKKHKIRIHWEKTYCCFRCGKKFFYIADFHVLLQ